MCTVGGPVDIDFDEGLEAKSYKCNDCGSSFKSLGKKVRCSSCGSKNVTEV